MKRNLKTLFLYLLFPVVFFINLIKKIYFIKFCKIDEKFGQVLRFTEGFLISKKYYSFPELENCKIIFLLKYKDCNEQQIKMVKRVLKVHNFSLPYYLLINALNFWNKKEHIIDMGEDYPLKKLLLRSDKNPYDFYKKNFINFTEIEKIKAEEYLSKFGLTNEDKWICITNRDENYKNKKYKNFDWSYHNYRNFSVNSLKEAANFFASKGYYVFRMGSMQKEALNCDNTKIIDYANSNLKNQFMDVYLLGNCEFYFGGDTGPSDISFNFRRPAYGINFSSTMIDYGRSHLPWLFTVKRIQNNLNGKLLTLKETLNSKFAQSFSFHDFIENNVIPIENSSRDISLFAEEVYSSFQEKNYDTQQDLNNQKKFWEIYYSKVPKSRMGQIQPKISSSFLRNNIDLLS